MAAFAGLVLYGESTAGRVFVGLSAWFAIAAARKSSPSTSF